VSSAAAALALLAIAPVALGACGGGADGDAPSAGGGIARAGVDTSQPPTPSRVSAGSRRAMAAGRAACKSKRSTSIVNAYVGAAGRRVPASERAFVRNVERNLEQLRRNAAFPQIAARLYAMSLPRAQRRDGFAGCAFELSRGERPASGGSS